MTAREGSPWALPPDPLSAVPAAPPALVCTRPLCTPSRGQCFSWSAPGAVCIVLTAARPPRAQQTESPTGGGGALLGALLRRGASVREAQAPSAEGRAVWPVLPGCRSGRRGRPPGARV